MDRTVWGYCRVSSVDQNLDRYAGRGHRREAHSLR